jgi:hypothetical protein
MLYIALLLLIVFSILFNFLFNKKEGFLNPGVYPLSEDKPLLYENYNLIEHPNIYNLGSSDIYHKYPIYPATSTKNNNVRYWENPNNGTCAPADMCGGLYADTNQNIPTPTPAPDWSALRVNFYQYQG